MYLSSLRAVHQNASKWQKVIIGTSVYIQFWKYFKILVLLIFLIVNIIIFLFTQIYTKTLANICEKFFENMLTRFWLIDFASNWGEPGKGMHEWPGSNRVNFCYKEFEKFKLYSTVSQSQVPVFVYFEQIIIWSLNMKFSWRLKKYSKCTHKQNKTTVHKCEQIYVSCIFK